MPVQKVAGRKLYISGSMPSPDDDVDAADFAGQTWVEAVSKRIGRGNL